MTTVLKKILWLLKFDCVCTDNLVFRLHYKYTVQLIMLYVFVATTRQLFGEKINCAIDYDNIVDTGYIESYCWMRPNASVLQMPRETHFSDLLGLWSGNFIEDYVERPNFHQWVYLLLIAQAMFFCVPRLLWKYLENKRIHILTKHLRKPNIDIYTRREAKRLIIDFFSVQRYSTDYYIAKFMLCEFLNLVNVIIQIWFVNCLFDGEFTSHGLLNLLTNKNNRIAAMSKILPDVQVCSYEKYSIIGNRNGVHQVCSFPLNVFYQELFVVLWLWYWVLAITTVATLLKDLSIGVSTNMRIHNLKFHAHDSKYEDLHLITTKFKLADWFTLHQIGINVNHKVFSEIIRELSGRFRDGL